ncbi:MAG: hypothetical protein ACE5NW_06060 [Acidiferrobacterales bacterium]
MPIEHRRELRNKAIETEVERLLTIISQSTRREIPEKIAEAAEWAGRAARLYRRAITDSTHFAAKPEYRHKYQASIEVFEVLVRMAETGKLVETLEKHSRKLFHPADNN